MVRCKFRVTSKVQEQIEGRFIERWSIELSAVWAGSPEAQETSENAIFGRWTPSGSIRLVIQNPAAAAQLEGGKEYYVDFTPAG